MLGGILVYVLPLRYALVPLALSISMYPSNLLLPPRQHRPDAAADDRRCPASSAA